MWAIVGGFSWCPNWPVIWTDLIVTVSFFGGIIAAIWVVYVVINKLGDWYDDHQFSATGQVLGRVGHGLRFVPVILLGLIVVFLVSAFLLALIQRWFPCN